MSGPGRLPASPRTEPPATTLPPADDPRGRPPSQGADAARRSSELRRPALPTDGVDRARPKGRGVEPWSHGVAVDRAASVLAERGTHGLERWLRSNAGALAALARESDEGLRQQLAHGLSLERGSGWLGIGLQNRWDAADATGMVRQLVTGQVRERVRRLAVARVDAVRAAVIAQRAEQVAELARASGDERLGGLHGVTDAARALVDTDEELARFRGHLFGATWEPVDFPATRARVACQLGLDGASAHSLAAEVLGQPRAGRMAAASSWSTHVDIGIVAAESSVAAAQGAQLLHAGAASAGVAVRRLAAVAVPGGAVVLTAMMISGAIGAAIEDDRAARREVARGLGL